MLINWEIIELNKSILTAALSSEDIEACLDIPLTVLSLPCHGQAIERTVKKVSEVNKAVVGHEKRDSFI